MKRRIMSVLLSTIVSTSIFTELQASDPQIFVYRNDTIFNSAHLGTGASVKYSVDDMTMLFKDEKGNITTIPMSSVDSCVFRMTDIPTMHFVLPDYPDVKDIWSKEDYVDALLKIEGNGYCEDSDTLKLSLRGRGNSTWGMAKKPMRMKLPKKKSLFGLEKQKNYVLLANYIDNSLMENVIAFWIARRIGVPYANHTVPVNVEINGYPRGSYIITEKVGINSGSVDIDETKGILFELSQEYDEPYKFRSKLWDLPVMVKDPDFDELAEENPDGPTPDKMLQNWENDFNNALTFLNTGRGIEAFDMDSFAKGYLLYYLCRNNELGHPKSMYIHKEQIGTESLYKFGPAWDFDSAFDRLMPDNDGTFVPATPNVDIVINKMLQAMRDIPEFRTAYKTSLQKFVDEDLEDLIAFIKEYAELIEPSSKQDACVWPESYAGDWFYRNPASDVKKRADELCEWMRKHVAFMVERANSGQY